MPSLTPFQCFLSSWGFICLSVEGLLCSKLATVQCVSHPRGHYTVSLSNAATACPTCQCQYFEGSSCQSGNLHNKVHNTSVTCPFHPLLLKLILFVQSKRDLITGLKTRTIAGRPNWDKVFRDIKNNRYRTEHISYSLHKYKDISISIVINFLLLQYWLFVLLTMLNIC